MERLEYWLDGQLAKTITPNPAVGHLGIHVPQGHLLQAIMEAAQAYDTFEYRLNSRVTELLQDASGRYNGVRAICNGEEFIVNCRLVVGADGRYSTVRKKANIDTTIRKHGYDLLWARIPAPTGWSPSIKMALVRWHANFTIYASERLCANWLEHCTRKLSDFTKTAICTVYRKAY